jgi:glycosyltransferase involved in cell wall biosynthesis
MSKYPEVEKVYIFTRELPNDISCKGDNVVVKVISKKFRFYYGLKKIIKKEIKNENNIIIINHFINLMFFPKRLKREKNIKVITKYYSPNLIVLFRRRKNFKLDFKQTILFIKRSILDVYSMILSDIIIGNSTEIENLGKRVAGFFHIKRKFLTFPTPVDTDFFYRKDRYKKDSNKILLLFVGNLLARKGIFDLLEIAKILRGKKIKYKLEIIGSYVYKRDRVRMDELIRRYEMEDSVEFVETVSKEELADYYNKSDIFLFPSYYEGSPRVVKEAMACGLPVISYDIAGIRLVDQGKKLIQMVKPGDKKGFSGKVLELIENREKLKVLSMKSARNIEKNFSIDEIAKKELELLSELVKN